ncbi:MAG: AsmA family protein [Myxococcota bacterium]
MRKALLVAGSVVVLASLLILLVPFLFKDRIVAAVAAQVNRHVDATVKFDTADLTLFRSFPNLELALGNLTVTGKEPFDGVVLARVADARLALDLMSVVGGGTVVVRSLALHDADVHLLVDAQGRSNMDVTKDDPAAAPTDTPSDFSLDLDAYTLENVALTYEDRAGGLLVSLADLDATGSVKVSRDANEFGTKASIATLSVTNGGVELLREVAVTADLQARQDLATGVFTLGDTRLALNDLAVAFKGTVAPSGDDIGLDLTFAAGETPFASILSLLPAAYSKDVAGLVSSGSVALQGSVKGTHKSAAADHLPGFDLTLQVVDGSFQYPSLPSSVDAVNLEMVVRHPEGITDLVEVDVKRFALAVGGSPLTGSFSLRHPMTDPDVAARMVGVLDLGKLHQALPAASSTWQGRLDVDLDVAGRVSQFTTEGLQTAQEGVRADGRFVLEGFRWEEPSDKAPMVVDRLAVTLNPRRADITELGMTLGASDIRATGSLDNIIAYALTDATLVGRMDVASKFLDLDAFAGGDEAPGEPTAADESSIVVVPKDLDFAITAKAEKVRYGGHEATEARGTFAVKDGALRIDSLKMNLLGGAVGLTGSYTAADDAGADVDMALDLADFDVTKTVEAFETLQKIVPVAQGAKGRFGSGLRVKARLGRDLTPEIESVLSDGRLRTSNLTLTPAFLTQVAETLGAKRFSTLDLSDADLGFVMEKGRIAISPTALKIGGAAATLGGSTGVLDRTLDLDLGMTIPAGLADGIVRSSSFELLKEVKVKVGGTYDKPTVKLDMGGVVDAVKEQVLAGVGVVSDKVFEEARKQGAALVAEAERQATKLKAEAAKQADGLKAEAKKQGDKLVAEAKNPIAAAAAKEAKKKLLVEADKKIDKLRAEADRKADAGVAAAKKQSDKLIADAEAESKAKTKAALK